MKLSALHILLMLVLNGYIATSPALGLSESGAETRYEILAHIPPGTPTENAGRLCAPMGSAASPCAELSSWIVSASIVTNATNQRRLGFSSEGAG